YDKEVADRAIAPHVSMGFNNMWILLNDVVPRAITKYGGFGPEALAKAARDTDIPEGGTMQGYGVKFNPPGHRFAGQNERSFPAVFEIIEGKFEVAGGEVLGLIGPNGSGKTTLFNCVSGALPPTAGSVRLRGVEIGGLTPDKICHRGIARTFQIPRPFRKLTILENVSVAAHYGTNEPNTEAQARSRAREMLELVGLPTDPEAATTSLGAGGLKKLELARAL